jgi:hypothetical protein
MKKFWTENMCHPRQFVPPLVLPVRIAQNKQAWYLGIIFLVGELGQCVLAQHPPCKNIFSSKQLVVLPEQA